MMKKIEDAEKVADEIAGVGEKNPASKKRSCIKCKIELASDSKLPFCPACWEEIISCTKGIAVVGAIAPLAKKYGPKIVKMVSEVLAKK